MQETFCTITETGQTNRELSYFDEWERATKQVTGITCCMYNCSSSSTVFAQKHLGMNFTNTPAATAQQ